MASAHVQVAAAVLAIIVAFVPRRRSLPQIAALAAAVLIAVQLFADHWFYLYIVWFVPLRSSQCNELVAALHGCSRDPQARGDGLENRYGLFLVHRGFESLPLRFRARSRIGKPVLPTDWQASLLAGWPASEVEER